MAKNIEINYNTGNGYEQLWPKTLLGNVMDWNSSIYSKSETYSKDEVNNIIWGLPNTYYTKNEVYNKTEINGLLSSSGGWKKLGSYTSINTQDIVIGNVYDYWRKELCFVLDWISGTFTRASSTTTSSYVTINLLKSIALYQFGGNSDTKKYLFNFSGSKKPFVMYRPLAGKYFGFANDSSGDAGIGFSSDGESKFHPDPWGKYSERETNTPNSFTIDYTGIRTRDSNLSMQVSVFIRDTPSEYL